MRALLPLLIASSLALTAAAQSGFDHSHAALTAVLAAHVKGGRVDYKALNRNPAPLQTYLDVLAAVPRGEFDGWGRAQRLAFLINLYNAATLKLIVDHYPVKSIKDIGGLFSSPWKQAVVQAFGGTHTLDQIEHGMIRPKFGEPRAHFAVNCASIGCPPLRAEAYDASRLDAQLDDQARAFLEDSSKNRVAARKGALYLSPIFKWFKADFTAKSGTVERFIAPFVADEDARAAVLSGRLSISYTVYDWGLNAQ